VVNGNATNGNNCIIKQVVTTCNRYMNKPNEALIISDNVNIGAGEKLFSKITIGDNANIDTNAVVIYDVEKKCFICRFPKEQPNISFRYYWD
jgi:serine O-acetyltransferase